MCLHFQLINGITNGVASTVGVCFGDILFRHYGAPTLFFLTALFDLLVALNYALTFHIIPSLPHKKEKEERDI
jgi:uncharacterized membrane protein YfcA